MAKRQYDLVNERSIIVAALMDSKLRKMILGAIDAEEFLGSRFKVIFQALVKCEDEGVEPDYAAVQMHSEGEDFGGVEYLKKLSEHPVPENIAWHISQLKSDYLRFSAKKKIEYIERRITDKTIPHSEIMRAVQDLKESLEVEAVSSKGISKKWAKDLDSRCSGEMSFQSTGFAELDDALIDGLAKRQVSVIAARTGNGKTTFVADMVRRLHEHNGSARICVMPLEIGPIRFLDKLISSKLAIPAVRFRKYAKRLTLEERDELKFAASEIVSDGRISIIDNPFFRLEEWSNAFALDKLEGIVAGGNYDLVIMDLFQRMLADFRPSAIELALVRVQYLAQQYDVHFCLVHQISRRVEDKRSKRPELPDLKGSGGYEEIPDLILLLHRAKAYKRFRRKDDLEIKIAKQRDYAGGVTFVGEFFPAISRVENLSQDEEEGKEDEGEKEEL